MKEIFIGNLNKSIKFFLYLLIFTFLFYSCGKEDNKDNKDNKKNAKLESLYKNKLKTLEKDPQFIIDKLEILFFKKGLHNNEAAELLNKIPKKYKKIIFVYSLIFSNDLPENVKLDKNLLKLLLKYQECNNILKFIADNYYKPNNNLSEKAFYTLYALNYNFSKENYENYLKVDKLSEFITLNFLSPKKDYCENDNCSKSVEDKEKFINNIKQQIYTADLKNINNNKRIYKTLLKKIRVLKKEIKKLSYKNKKLKRKNKLSPEDEDNLNTKIEELKFYKTQAIPILKVYLYFYGKERRLPKGIDKVEIANEFFINNTKMNKKIFYFVYSYAKSKAYPIKLTFYKYFKDTKLKLSKRNLNKVKYLKYSKKYKLLKYGFYKKNLPDLFKKLKVSSYIGSDFVFTVVKDFEWYFLEKFRNNNKNIKNLLYFQYAPELIMNQKDKLFKLYTTDTIENVKIAGNESYIFTLLKIFLKANVKLTKEQLKILEPVKIIYIQEILKYLK